MNSLNFREPTQPPLAHSTSVSSLNCRELTFLFFVSPPCRKSYEFTYDSSHRFLRYWFFLIKTAAAFDAPNLSWSKSGQFRVGLFSCLSSKKKSSIESSARSALPVRAQFFSFLFLNRCRCRSLPTSLSCFGIAFCLVPSALQKFIFY